MPAFTLSAAQADLAACRPIAAFSWKALPGRQTTASRLPAPDSPLPNLMPTLTLSAAQADLAALPSDRRIFLEGVAGTGKTTAGVARLLRLLAEGVPADASWC